MTQPGARLSGLRYSPSMTEFASDVVDAVLRHMNADHNGDSLTIVRANGAQSATEAVMTGFDSETASWRVTEPDGQRILTLRWSRRITERPEIRQEIVALHDAALAAGAGDRAAN